MDARHFDALARALTERDTRRGLLGLFATIPVLGGLVTLLDLDGTDAKGRRKRRKKRHKHGKGRRRKGKCQAKSRAKLCAGTCGMVKNNCGKKIDCGPCACDLPCPVCQVCDAVTAACVPDLDQQGAACGEPGQVCRSDGSCACDPASCAACQTCQSDGRCSAPCHGQGCCDGAACQPGTTQAACGTGGAACAQCGGETICQAGACGCTLTTCAEQGKNCGEIDDGCGGTLDCGACTAPDACGGGDPGTPNVCGCAALTTCPAPLNCGDIDNGCGSTVNCGHCSAPDTCGGGNPGTPNVCGCTPLTTCPGGKNCGTISDGCDGTINCGTCTGFDTCGGGTPPQANICGCTAKTCAQLGKNCGMVDDGCGGTIDCGGCSGAAPICTDNVCTTCSSGAQCQGAGLGNLCCGGECLSGACCDNTGCSGTTPICDAAHTCVACETDSECGPNALCLADGSCRACTVTCSGTPAECGGVLQTAIYGRGTVYVCPGTYQGPFYITEGVTVIGAGDGENPASNTILSGNDQVRVVETTIHNGSVDLQRLRITGGRVRNFSGAGIFHRCNFLRLADCTITGNTVENQNGGAIATSTGNITELTRCTLSNNLATGGGPANGRGGAIYASGPVTVNDCIIEGNTAFVAGGGIEVDDRKTTLTGNTIVRNNRSTQFESSGGGGIESRFGTVEIAETCRVTGNTASPGQGGGIRNVSGVITLQGTANPSPIVANNCHENCTGNVPNCAPGGTCPP